MAQNDQQQQHAQQPQQQQFQQMQGGGLDFSNFMPQQQQQQQQGMNSFQLFSQAQPQAGFASGGFPGAGAFGGGLGGLGGDFSVYGGGSKPTDQQQQQQQAYATQQAAMYQQPALMNAQMLAMQQQGFQQSQFAQFPQSQQPRQQSYTSLTGVPPVGQQQQQQQHHNSHNQGHHQGGGRGHGRNPPRQQGPEISWDEWMSRLDAQVVAKVRELISEGHLTDRGLDSGCLEELSRNPPQAALTTLATFRDVVSNPKTHQPVNNPSAYLTRMLKNPHQPGGGYNGRGGGRGGRGRGRGGGQRYDPEHAAEVEQMLRESFGELYDQLDDGAQNFARKSTKEAISHLCEEWQTQVASNNEVKNISAWATKILISHRSKPTSAQPQPDPHQGQIQPASPALQAQAQQATPPAPPPAASTATEATPAAAAQE